MPNKTKIIEIIKSNKWIILSALFFVFWKFFLISTMFGIDFKDPRFDDTVVYISHIESILDCPSWIFCKDFLDSFVGYGGFEHLTYRLFFGALGKILNLNSQNTFFLSFYIGTLMIVPVLILLLKKINSNKNLVALSLFFLALYNGAGSYHGFFWVVPSFFALLLFFLIFVVINSQYKNWKLYLFILIPSMLYTHYLGLYFLPVLVFFFLFYSAFNKKIDKRLLRKTIFTIIIALLFYIPTSLFLKNSPYGGNSYGVETFAKQMIQNFNENTSKNADITISLKYFPSINQVKTDYLNFLFPHWIFIFAFLAIIYVLFFYRQYFILSLFFASMAFTLTSSINTYGYRSLLITWPLTYILYAYGTWFALKFIKENIQDKVSKHFLKGVLIFCLIIFITANLIYSYTWNTNFPISVKELFLNVILFK